MRLSAALVLGICLVGCHQRKPAVSDADFEAFRLGNPGMTQKCRDDYRYGGIAAANPDDPACFEMTAPQQWSGIWVHGFEWTNFCPDPAKACPIYGAPGVNWLTGVGRAPLKMQVPDGSYHLQFIGRRTKSPGHFGHLSQYDNWIVVDKVISLRRLPERTESSAK